MNWRRPSSGSSSGGGGGGGGGGSSSILLFGNNGLTNNSQTRYLTPGYDGVVAPLTAIGFLLPVSGILNNLFVQHGTPAAEPGGDITYTVYVNGVGTDVAVVLNSAEFLNSNLVDFIAVEQGDFIDIRVTKGVIPASPVNVYAFLNFVAS